MATAKLKGPGRLPSPENLADQTPEQLMSTLSRFGIDPDVGGIMARGDRAFAKFERLISEGQIPDDALLEQLTDSVESEFQSNLVKMTKTAIRNYRERNIGDDDMGMWVTSGRDTVCGSCEPRHGQIRKMSDWRKRGLPGSSALLCGEYCNCQIIPA